MELTTKSAYIPLVVSGVDMYAHVLEFHVLMDRSMHGRCFSGDFVVGVSETKT